MVLTISRVVNVVMAGLLTGNEFGSRVAVHPAFDGLPLPAHLQAEQALTRRYGRIMPVFMSSAIASFLPVLALTQDRKSPPYRLSQAGLLCYAAMLAVTLTGNVPINNRLLALNPDTATQAEFLALRDRWDRLHTARNLLNILGLTLTVAGAVSPPGQRGEAGASLDPLR